ncbi:DUF3768 domain-containing protein [uncultured Tateyamaria sp.]|uniref:DUF3768 domain-containing protein n=1 Tax=uncultured Tateyamaria sp. TaxID=455651 RepID=UPI0026316143|nr:DUF3768 domain-containing protein [uncultured Tateyamaria sp.]
MTHDRYRSRRPETSEDCLAKPGASTHDLYDENYEYGSEAPTDPTRTRRVLTLLFPSEY